MDLEIDVNKCLKKAMSKKETTIEIFHIIETTVKVGANVHYDQNFPLRRSIYRRNSKLVKFLLENGANPNDYNHLFLRYAANTGCDDIIQYLIDYGFKLYGNINYALEGACENGRYKAVELLLKYGADPCNNNNYCFRMVVLNGFLKIFKLILPYGRDINIKTDSALLDHSLYYNKSKMTKYLLEIGILINHEEVIRWMNNHPDKTTTIELLKRYM